MYLFIMVITRCSHYVVGGETKRRRCGVSRGAVRTGRDSLGSQF